MADGLSLSLQKLMQHIPDIPINADGLLLNFSGAFGLALVKAGIGCPGIARRHLPEGQLDDGRGVLFTAHHFLEAVCRY